MIVVIFISARAHMQYLRCSLVIYASPRVVSQCNGERCLCAIKVNVLPLSFVTRGILKQYCSLSSGIGALFVPFVLLFLWPIM